MSLAITGQNSFTTVAAQAGAYILTGALGLWRCGLIGPAIGAIQHTGKARAADMRILTRSSGTQRFLATISTVLIAGGISNLVSKLFENPFIFETEGMTCPERIEAAKNNLNICPEAKTFWDKIEVHGPVSFECVPQFQAPGGAVLDVPYRTILFAEPGKATEPSRRILGQKSATCLTLYELKNLHQHEKIKDLYERALYEEIPSSEFVYEIESLEFDTAMAHHEISKRCTKSGWNPEIAQQYNFGPDSPVQFSEKDRKEWFRTSPVAQHIKPTDSDAKIKYIMLNDKIGHTQLSAQRLQNYLDSFNS